MSGGKVPDTEAHWKVGEFRSSYSQKQIVLVLSVGAAIERNEQHHSFVRWVYTHPTDLAAAIARAEAIRRAYQTAFLRQGHGDDLLASLERDVDAAIATGEQP